MRLLPEWANHDCQGAAGPQSESDGCADSRVHGENAVSLHDLLPRPARHQARRESDRRHWVWSKQGGYGMTTFTSIPKQIEQVLEKCGGTTSRRNFLKSSGFLAVSVAASPLI